MTRMRGMYLGTSSMTPAERSKGRFMRAPDDHPAGAPGSAVLENPPSFEDAFAAAMADGGDAVGAPAADPAPAAADPAPAAAPAEPAPAAAEPAPAAAPAEGAPAAPAAEPAPAEPAPAAQPTAAEIARALSEQLGTAPAPQQQQAPAGAPAYTPDEQKLLTDYESNWPDVAKAESLKRRTEYHDLLAYVFAEVGKFVSPVMDQVRNMGNTMHTGELKALVPDYSANLEADVAGWVDTQPNYLQAGMKAVMQGGTSDEVADLIRRYRAATGAAPAAAPAAPAAPAPGAPAPKAAKAPAVPKTELSEAAKQAVVSLAPVGSERSQVPVGEDLQDFDSAFAKYAATMTG
jgi:hypothetical protein